jgi:hypothetical protein
LLASAEQRATQGFFPHCDQLPQDARGGPLLCVKQSTAVDQNGPYGMPNNNQPGLLMSEKMFGKKCDPANNPKSLCFEADMSPEFAGRATNIPHPFHHKPNEQPAIYDGNAPNQMNPHAPIGSRHPSGWY